MKVFAYCVALGVSLGLASAVSMEAPLPWLFGPLLGGGLAILASPIVLLRQQQPRLFEVLAAAWTVTLPVSVVAGMTHDPVLAIFLTALSMAGGFFGIVRRASTHRGIWGKSAGYLLPAVCLVIGSITAAQRRIPDDVSSLIEMLGNNDMDLQSQALQRLVLHGKQPLLEGLRHRKPGVRANAAHGLGLLHDPSAEGDLLESAVDSDRYVRMWSAYSLGEIGSAKALPTLERLLNDPEAIVRMNAEQALKKLRGRIQGGAS